MIKVHIKDLQIELEAISKNCEFYKKVAPGSLGYERLNLGVKLWEFKIAFWEALL